MRTVRGERAAFLVLAALSLLLRTFVFLRLRVDTDEPQHLHVTWGWTAGYLQYRDIFDNHTPLFHILSAPLLSILGERPDVVTWMRIPMWVLYAIVVISTYVVGSRLYSRRIGAWSALLLSMEPTFFLKSIEYRNDNLWSAFFMLALVAGTGGTLTPLRLFWTGLFLGCAFATSFKTVLLLVAVGGAAVALLIRLRRPIPWRLALASAAGFLIVPAAIAIYFIARDALPDLLYGVYGFNSILTRIREPSRMWAGRFGFVLAMWVLIRVAWRQPVDAENRVSQQRFFLGYAAGQFFVFLLGWWLMISPRDTLAILPLLAIFAVAFIDRQFANPVPVYIAAVLFCVVLIAKDTDRFRSQISEYTAMLDETLRLSRPGEPVMDLKGEAIYRPRPHYLAFEYITRQAMRRGLIRDTVAEDLIRSKCYVAQSDNWYFPPRSKAFLNENYIDVGRVRAAGKKLAADGTFTIAIPGPYVIVGRAGELRGVLDGAPYNGGGRYLAAGRHTFAAGSAAGPVACLWAPAFERGFSPFSEQATP